MTQNQIRMPVWAGSFYPADKIDLINQIESLKSKKDVSSGLLRGVIMPHAGYIYSGHTASHAAHDLHNNNPKNIILLGPDHHVGMATCHVCQKQYWQTPLGQVKISQNTKNLLEQQPHLFQNNPLSDLKEHSLEVIIPFLQTWITDFEILPIVTGQIDSTQLASAIRPLITQDTVLVVSSDLSHFLSDSQARIKDKRTIAAIVDMSMDDLVINDNKACGLTPICTLLTIAKAFKWQPKLLHYSNSGDVSGDKNRVVGYAAIGFYEEDSDENN